LGNGSVETLPEEALMLYSHTARVLMAPAALAGIVIGCGGKPSQPEPKPAAVVFEDRLVISDTDDKTPLGIPPTQLPAPGNCRVWYPGRSAVRQPPAEPCNQAETRAVADNWILYRPREDPRLVHVRIIQPDDGGPILGIRVYDAERGTYLGTRQPKRVPKTPQ
jgi:hypothetical protein